MQSREMRPTYRQHTLAPEDRQPTLQPHETPQPRLGSSITSSEMFKPSGHCLNGKLAHRHIKNFEPVFRHSRTSSKLFSPNDNNSLVTNLVNCVGRLRLEQSKLHHEQFIRPSIPENVLNDNNNMTLVEDESLRLMGLTYDRRDRLANQQFSSILKSALDTPDLNISFKRLTHRLEGLEKSLSTKKLTTSQWIRLQDELTTPALELFKSFVKEAPEPSNHLQAGKFSAQGIQELRAELEGAAGLQTLVRIEQAKNRDFPIPPEIRFELEDDAHCSFEPNRRLEYELSQYRGITESSARVNLKEGSISA